METNIDLREGRPEVAHNNPDWEAVLASVSGINDPWKVVGCLMFCCEPKDLKISQRSQAKLLVYALKSGNLETLKTALEGMAIIPKTELEDPDDK